MAPRGVTITLDNAIKMWPLTQNIAQHPNKLLMEACKEANEKSVLVKNSINMGVFSNIRRYFGGPNGLICTILEAHHSGLHLVLHPDDIKIGTLAQTTAADYKISSQNKKSPAPNYKILVEDRINPDNDEELAQKSISKLKEGTQFQGQELPTNGIIELAMRQPMKPSAIWDRKYPVPLSGGIQSVTLLGEKAEWQALLPLLEENGIRGREDMEVFRNALRPIFDYLVKSFDNPEDPEIVDFWKALCYNETEDRGQLSGWVAAFNRWQLGGDLTELAPSKATEKLGIYVGTIDDHKVCPGYGLLAICDSGNPKEVATFAAGIVGTEFWSGKPQDPPGPEGQHEDWYGIMNCVRPASAYFIFEA